MPSNPPDEIWLRLRHIEEDSADGFGAWFAHDAKAESVAYLRATPAREHAEKLREALKVALSYLELMTTCHECQASLREDDCPPHCEDCSYDCEVHDGLQCDPDATHRATWEKLRAAIKLCEEQ